VRYSKKNKILVLCILSTLVISCVIFSNASIAFGYTVTLSWDPPPTNADGSPLTDLGGYKVYYGTTSNTYSKTIDVGKVTTYKINLATGVTYYFAVTAYNQAGYESDFSNTVSKTKYILTTKKDGTGKGTVTSSPAGIICGSDCREEYDSGRVVTLEAIANAGSIFAGWSGDKCAGDGQCVSTIDENTIVTATFERVPTSITVTSPNGNEQWQAGTTQTIRWTYTGNPGEYVKIMLKNQTICPDAPVGSNGNGSYTWSIPLEQIPNKNYRVRVISAARSSFRDISDRVFTIIPPLVVTSPNGGENWQPNTNKTITWSYIGNPGANVNILLYRGAKLYRTITTDTPIGNEGSGSYDWLIPADLIPGSIYRIRIISTINNNYQDISNNYFSIKP